MKSACSIFKLACCADTMHKWLYDTFVVTTAGTTSNHPPPTSLATTAADTSLWCYCCTHSHLDGTHQHGRSGKP